MTASAKDRLRPNDNDAPLPPPGPRPAWREVFSLVWLIVSTTCKIVARLLTSRECTQALAWFGALLAVVSSGFWYLSAKGAMEPHPSLILLRVNNLFNFWAGGLAAVSSLCVALSVMLKRD